MRSWLKVCNVDGTQCTFIDGSGLSKQNRTTANTVVDLLTAIRQHDMFDTFTKTLSVAGHDADVVLRLAENLDDQDDVQNVWSNFDISDEEAARLAGA